MPVSARAGEDADGGADAGAARGAPAGCAAEVDALPELVDYALVTDGGRYRVDVRRDPSGAVVPTRYVAMPLHHASRLALDPEAEVRGRLALRQVVRVAFELVGRDIEHDPSRHVWFATYRARVLAVCEPPIGDDAGVAPVGGAR